MCNELISDYVVLSFQFFDMILHLKFVSRFPMLSQNIKTSGYPIYHDVDFQFQSVVI